MSSFARIIVAINVKKFYKIDLYSTFRQYYINNHSI